MPRPATDGLAQYLVQVSLDPTQNRHLRAVRVGSTETFVPSRDRNVFTFAQWCNPTLATAWLRAARHLDAAAIDRLEADKQLAAVTFAWQAFFKFFIALNVSPYAWSKLRRVLEHAWGASHAVTAEGKSANADDFNPSAAATGSWRRRVRDDWVAQHPGGDAVTYVVLGRAPNPSYCGTYEVCGLPDDPTDPGDNEIWPGGVGPNSPDGHRLYVQASGQVIGTALGPVPGAGRGTSGDPAAWRERLCSVSAQGFDWRCYARTRVPYATREALAVLPALKWYWDLLFSPVPGLRAGVGHGAEHLFRAPLAPGDLSLAEYLAALGPLEMVREVRLDVIYRNKALARAHRLPEADLVAYGQYELARANQRAFEGARAESRTLSGIAGALVAASPVPGAGVAFAVAGLIVGAAALVRSIFGAPEASAPVDVFGRWQPALETFRIEDDITQLGMRQLLEGRCVGCELGGMVPPGWEESATLGLPSKPPLRRAPPARGSALPWLLALGLAGGGAYAARRPLHRAWRKLTAGSRRASD